MLEASTRCATQEERGIPRSRGLLRMTCRATATCDGKSTENLRRAAGTPTVNGGSPRA